MVPTKVVLLACGSYNPPTNMHLRMFENARDYLQRMGNMKVIHGIISPVHDAYQKKDLLPAAHRLEMVRLAIKNNNWIHLSDWECQQSEWSRTVQVLQYHQNKLTSDLANSNKYLNNKQRHQDIDEVDDVPRRPWSGLYNDCEDAEVSDTQVRLLLLCGADLLESFSVPNLWQDEDIETIVGQHGLVVITREGYNPYRFIYESDILTKHMANIYIVNEWIANEVSSTKIRRALRRGDSIKYLVPDAVENYIKVRKLYTSTGNETASISSNDGTMDNSDGNSTSPQAARKVGRQSVKQENALNEANARRSSSVGRHSREEIPKAAPRVICRRSRAQRNRQRFDKP